ncbi:MAG: sugar phosphate nucleotidyltransferase [Candidatus Marinimicrobia bacterium]|nr:sugar phosphate nucleotidyltransferase [Candidatus Neomarinimicrobiota bacterium]
MKAIIPAAGIGKRLRPHTFNRPKVMVPVAGKPILEHIAEALFQSGFNELSIIVGYQKETVIDHFEDRYPGRCRFLVQEEMKGLAHAILLGLEDRDEPALIILGDTIIDMDLSRFRDSKENIIAVVKVNDPSRFGIVETDKNGFITDMVEKPENPESDLAIAGAYFIKSQSRLKAAIEELLEKEIRTRGEFQLTDALAIMMDKGERFKAMPINDWYDCGKPETLLSTNRFILSKGTDNRGECINSRIVEPVYIDEGSRIENCTVGPDVAVGKNVSIQDSEIQNSMIFEGAELKKTTLSDSIVGRSARVSGFRGTLNTGDENAIEGDIS